MRQALTGNAVRHGDALIGDKNMTPLAALSLRNHVVTIGPILPEDTGSMFLWLNDVEAINLDCAYRPMDYLGFNDWFANLSKNPSQLFFAIRLIADPKIIGFIGLTNIQSVHRSAELGIRIGCKTNRGKGFGRLAIQLALKYAWNHLNLNRVQLTVLKSNGRAIRAYGAAGFECEGTLRKASYINGEWSDVVLMGIVRSSDVPSL